ncbi:hypothetical protein CSIM01_05602 [Colletotrichum simmondsii]|uniref:Carbohydrate kinase PfkB domain-containing protein n=1 Tax=Colletotrichum simmondsii TaxID=703756 RepID=A0A135SRP5_9PEZI|nr:hypothetical protein CSIM01_05602 [Colletotrichum simmondsii]
MEPNRKTIAVIGALSLDMHLTREQPPPPGEKIEEGVSASKDGLTLKGINTALAALETFTDLSERSHSKWVPDVRMVSVIGRDHHTENIIARVKAFGIGTKGIKIIPDKNTDAIFHVLTKSTGETKHDRIDNPATPACWTEEDFENAQSFGGDPKPNMIIISTELEEKVFTKILTCAKDNNIEVCLDRMRSGPIAESLLPLFTHITYLVVHGKEEAEELSSGRFRDEVEKKYTDDER